MRNALSLLFFVFISTCSFGQDRCCKTENIILVTFDGLRWQEVFGGIDSLFLFDKEIISDPKSLKEEFYDQSVVRRRELLLPFIWSEIAVNGQIYGNRDQRNLVDNANKQWFSYPGYNEILSGFPDDKRITSNDKINNPNKTFLEYLNNLPEYKGKVSAFCSWDVFPYIINQERSEVPVNAGFDKAENPSPTEVLISRLQAEIRGPWEEVRLDPFTHHFALEALKADRPKVMYIAYGETDDWAHMGNYEQYILSAKQTDEYIREIWNFIQSDPAYSNKTTLILTTDHGRGIDSKSWKSHGADIIESGQTWLAVIGPDTPAKGEMQNEGQLYPAMIARTIFELLDLEYPDEKAYSSILRAFH